MVYWKATKKVNGRSNRTTSGTARWRRNRKTPIEAIGLLLAALGAWSPFWNQNVELPIHWQRFEAGFPLSRYLGQELLSAPVWTLAAIFGVLGVIFPPVRDARWLALLLLAAAVSRVLVTLALLSIPWPYNFLSLFAVATPLAASAIDNLVGAPGRRRRTRTGPCALPVLLLGNQSRVPVVLASSRSRCGVPVASATTPASLRTAPAA